MLHATVFTFCLVSVLAQSPPPGNVDPTKQEHSHEVPQYYQQPDPKRVKEALSDLFGKLDTNKDNYLDAAEMKAWLKVVHGSMINDNIDRQWEYFADKLKDGSLPWEEYRKVTFSDDGETASATEEEKKHLKDQLARTERRWAHADDNGDGLLTKDEFRAFLHPEEDPAKNDIVVTEAIEMMDTDGDKIIALSEYMDHLKSVAGPEKNDDGWLKEQQAHFTTYLDKNKDGSLDRDEMKEWVIPNFDREEGEAWRFISFADQDRDTKLTRTDILQNPDQFLGLLPGEFWAENAAPHDGRDLKHNEL
ncbi:calumenin [Galendromus occidentalis]|uniref:Reticulocalbin-3 n=1 Tax=Galendromus occidentalis TaxID=34638 RepID=A0AAJ6QVK1_9ACAR|nr:calumenin [Galendromus occidentalis]